MTNQELEQHIEYFKGRDLTYSIDALTDVLNRVATIGYIDWLVQHKRNFSLFLIDIDNFKNVNDSYGHFVGDEVLAQVAEYLKNIVGYDGVIGRYGGDEFIVVWEGISEYSDVWHNGHMLDANIGEINFKGIPNLSITISTGVARYPLNGDNYSELFNVADKALYRAKMKGRNCFIIYLPEKHASISIKRERDKVLTPMQHTVNIFSALTAYGDDISSSIQAAFKSFVSNYMYDHICLETHKDISHSVVFALSDGKEFEHIEYGIIEKILNSAGFISLSQTWTLNKSSYGEIVDEFEKQGISATVYCKISAYGHDYGYIRVDTISTARIWQNDEIAMLMYAANTIGLLLYYQNKTLEELAPVPTEVIGVDN